MDMMFSFTAKAVFSKYRRWRGSCLTAGWNENASAAHNANAFEAFRARERKLTTWF
jgi:hypothetical protein